MQTERELSRNFGEKLRFYRQQKRYSLKDVQRMTGIDAGYISKLETLSRRNPSFSIISTLADALDVDVSDLIDIDIPEAPLRNIEEVLIYTEYLLDGKLPTSAEREALLSIVQTLLCAEWREETKHIDTVNIIYKVDNLLKLLR